MGNVVTFVKLMESAGMGRVKKLGKVIAQQGDDVIREAVFANGRHGTYRVSNFMGAKTQSVFDGQKFVEFATEKGTMSKMHNPLVVNGKDIELLPTIHSWSIKEPINGSDVMQRLASGRAEVTPLRSKFVKGNNGKLQQRVFSNQEIHTSTKLESDKGFGTMYERKDIMIDTEGKARTWKPSANSYVPESNPGFGKDLTKKPIYYSATTGCKTQYTPETPVAVLNADLGANFKSPLKPLWSRAEEMFWRLT